MSAATTLTTSDLRGLLTSFWNEAVEIEPFGEGLVFTMPASYPDGWQVILELCEKTPAKFHLNDRGKTLGWLTAQGQNLETETMKHHLHRLCCEHSLQMENGILSRWLESPLDAADIQVFTEGLVAISRLEILNEHRVAEEDVADTIVRRVLSDVGLEAKHRHKLNITKDRTVSVDYFIEQRLPSAIQILRTKSDIPGTMEKWGFRWHELKNNYAGLVPIMLYDRNSLTVDPYSRHIGETECSLFCGYDETDRLHEALVSIR
jgi:hypothetical protein